jgi:hypothetical protein
MVLEAEMKAACLRMAPLAPLAPLSKSAKKQSKSAKQECQVKYNNNNNLRLRVPRVPKEMQISEKATFKSAKSAKSMARVPRDDERLTKGRRQSKGLMLTEIAIDHCTESPRLSSREIARVSRFATSLMSLENANN